MYATAGYEQSVQNLAQTSLDSDMVFSDGYDAQLATVTGSVDQGFVATLGRAGLRWRGRSPSCGA